MLGLCTYAVDNGQTRGIVENSFIRVPWSKGAALRLSVRVVPISRSVVGDTWRLKFSKEQNSNTRCVFYGSLTYEGKLKTKSPKKN